MDRKMIMGVAAVAGIGLLLYMRKSGDQSTLAGSGSLVGAASSAANWASLPIVINASMKPAAVTDQTAGTAAPSTAAKVAPPAKVATFGGGGGGYTAPDPVWDAGQSLWQQSNGSAVSDSYAFGHLTPEQRGGKTDAQLAASLLW